MITQQDIPLNWLQGYISMWATRQSPYAAPENLTKVIMDFNCRVRASGLIQQAGGLDWVSIDDIKHLLRECLIPIPEVQEWNKSKNKPCRSIAICSAFNKPNPDEDFIDLDALVMNVVYSCQQENKI